MSANPGAIVASIGHLAGGVMERNAAYKASRVDEENARLAILAGEQETEAIRREQRFAIGESIARAGGSGLRFSGSFTDIVEDSAYQAELDVLRNRQKAYGEARNHKARGAERRRAGKAAFVAGVFNAVSTALGAAGDARAGRIASAGGGGGGS